MPASTPTQIRELMGTVPNAVFEQILDAVHANNSADVLAILGRLLDAGNGPQQLARQFVRYLRNCTIAKITNLAPDQTGARPRHRPSPDLPRRTLPRRPHRRALHRRRALTLPLHHAPHLRRPRLPPGAALPPRARPPQTRPPPAPPPRRRPPHPTRRHQIPTNSLHHPNEPQFIDHSGCPIRTTAPSSGRVGSTSASSTTVSSRPEVSAGASVLPSGVISTGGV